MSKFLTRRRAMSMSLAVLVAALATPPAFAEKWIILAHGKNGTKLAIDISSVISEGRNEQLIAWYKVISQDSSELVVRATFRSDRTWRKRAAYKVDNRGKRDDQLTTWSAEQASFSEVAPGTYAEATWGFLFRVYVDKQRLKAFLDEERERANQR